MSVADKESSRAPSRILETIWMFRQYFGSGETPKWGLVLTVAFLGENRHSNYNISFKKKKYFKEGETY